MDVNCETVFLKELQKNKSIILTKENTRSARDKKRLAWMTIQRSLIAASGREYSVQQLCKKWNNLQQRVKEKIRNSGGEKIPKSLHERDLLCLQIIGPENLNLPAGMSSLDLSSYPELNMEDEDTTTEDIPMVVNAEAGEKKLLDMLVHSIALPHSAKDNQDHHHHQQQQLLGGALVSSMGNTATTHTTTMLPLSQPTNHSNHNKHDVALQDFDAIQTNIFTELANRINQINGSVSLLTSAAAQDTHESSPDVTIVDDDARQAEACLKKRKREPSLSSDLSSDLPSGKDSDYIQSLKRDILLLKKEKLTLENQKIRLEINRLRREDEQTVASLSIVSSGTQTSD